MKVSRIIRGFGNLNPMIKEQFDAGHCVRIFAARESFRALPFFF